jgi:hypothetical protein
MLQFYDMLLLEVLQSVLVAILVSYLNFTNSLAASIETYVLTGNQPVVMEQAPTQTGVSGSSPSEELSLFSKLFAQSGTSRILSENDLFRAAFRGSSHSAAVIEAIDPATIEGLTEQSIVNIFCEYKTESYTRTTTGTGFFINRDGVILTNAHVAQFLLLEDVDARVVDTQCVVRNGNPALPRYTAELLFISPTWIFNNAKLITTEHPRGTGEYDYALLYISGSLDGSPLPTDYPALPFYTDFLSKNLTGASVVTAGYPAEKLEREGSRAALIPKVASTHIIELYTFGSNYADIFSITESPVGEQGASGGPIVHDTLGAIGLIVTKGDAVTEGEKSLRALTLSYIDRTIREETGYSLLENASGDLEYRGKIFKEVLAPFLSKLLALELEQ